MKSAGDRRQEIAISSSSYIPKPQVVRRVRRKPLWAGHFGEDSLPVLCSPGDSGDSSAACERSRLCRWGVKVPALGAVPRADAMSQCVFPSSCPVTSAIAQALPGQPARLHPPPALTHSLLQAPGISSWLLGNTADSAARRPGHLLWALASLRCISGHLGAVPSWARLCRSRRELCFSPTRSCALWGVACSPPPTALFLASASSSSVFRWCVISREPA